MISYKPHHILAPLLWSIPAQSLSSHSAPDSRVWKGTRLYHPKAGNSTVGRVHIKSLSLEVKRLDQSNSTELGVPWWQVLCPWEGGEREEGRVRAPCPALAFYNPREQPGFLQFHESKFHTKQHLMRRFYCSFFFLTLNKNIPGVPLWAGIPGFAPQLCLLHISSTWISHGSGCSVSAVSL